MCVCSLIAVKLWTYDGASDLGRAGKEDIWRLEVIVKDKVKKPNSADRTNKITWHE